ncbi:hypothetical protein GC197_05015 [bacterium]|nr:hypothetical protein [bacterium]
MTKNLPLFTLPVLAIILLGSGCSTIPKSDPVNAQEQAALPTNQPMILVEMQCPRESKSSSKKLLLSEAPTLQAAVVKSGAVDEYKRFHVAVSRLPQAPGAPPEKLVSKYDHVAKQVPLEYDYQLRPGDRVVVVEDPSTALDDMFGGLINPIRMAAGRPPVDISPF